MRRFSRRPVSLAGPVLVFFLASAAVPARDVRLTRDEEAALAQANILSRSFVAVAKIIRPAVVNIKVERRVEVSGFNNPFEFFNDMFGRGPNGRRLGPRRQIQQGQGSGVIIDNRGYILTNNHVVGDAESIRVLLLDGRELTAELIGADPASDVAVIRVKADNLTVARVGDSDLIEVGEWVMAVGNPFGLDFTVTSGIISARGRSGMGMMEVEDFIQTDASINPGNSGGPLVNLGGEVIGINTFIFSQPNSGGSVGVGFAIPSNIAKSIMQSLIAHRQVTASYLGVEVEPITQDRVQAYGLRSPRGALVRSVTKGSPAEKAGFRRGDVVVRWGKREISDDQQFRNLVTITTPGQPVDVEAVREGKTILLQVTLLASAPEMVIEGRSDRFLQGLGIEVADTTPEVLDKLGYESEAEGVVVTSVRRQSPAEQLGFMPGSLILNVNGRDVRDAQELRKAIGASERSKSYDLVWRNGNLIRRARLGGN
ncbi:MAG: Do family serine endopeptidase [Planctomycetota bacterium]|jgi:serine protease Do|nr:Do family serine endopeptidase [Planctomycetota bacterium]